MESVGCLDLPVASREDNLAFLALPAKHAAAQVTGRTNDLFKAALAILNQIIADVCATRTVEEFRQARKKHFAQYATVMLGVGNLISVVVPNDVIERLSWESLCEMEADFREQGTAAFGKDIADQALFTIWTLRKITEIVSRIGQSKAQQESISNAPELAQDFVISILVARFHLDCLKVSLRAERPLYPDALECISEGLRSLVNAYAYIRQASEGPKAEEPVISIDFDEEEQELVSLSMKDVMENADL